MVKLKLPVAFSVILIAAGLFLTGCAPLERVEEAESMEASQGEASQAQSLDNPYAGVVNFYDGMSANCHSYLENFECLWSKAPAYSPAKASGDFVANVTNPQTVYDDIATSSFSYPSGEDSLKYKKVLLDDGSITYCVYRQLYPERYDCSIVFPDNFKGDIIEDEEYTNW